MNNEFKHGNSECMEVYKLGVQVNFVVYLIGASKLLWVTNVKFIHQITKKTS